MSACRLVATSVSSEAGRLTMRAVPRRRVPCPTSRRGTRARPRRRSRPTSPSRGAARCDLVTTVSSLRGRDCASLKAKRMMRSTPARVIIDTSVATSIGWPWCDAAADAGVLAFASSRARSPSRGPRGVQRFSGASMPGRMRVGRTLAYWSKPWQIFRRRPHSVTWSGMCGSPAEPNRIASLPRSASRPSAGIISPWARYQSPPQPKSSNSKREAAAARRAPRSTSRPAGTTSLPMPSPGIVGDAVGLHAAPPVLRRRRPGSWRCAPSTPPARSRAPTCRSASTATVTGMSFTSNS